MPGMPGHLLPCREHDAVAVPPRNAPLLVAALVVGRVVVPAAAVRLEDRPLALEREVEEVRTAAPFERELANELGEAVRHEKPAGLHLQCRPSGVRRVELAEEVA